MIILPSDVRKVRKLALRLVRSVDPSYRIRWKVSPFTRYTWDGSGLLRTSESDIILSLHDVAHVLLSSPARRHLPEFGLGPDPANPSAAPRVVSGEDAQWEEDRVCELHWSLAVYFWGKEGGAIVADYLGLQRDPLDKVSAFAERFPSLPKDFTSKILGAFGVTVP